MLTMDQIHHIRELYYEQGITNISQIAEITKLNRKTVTKYIDMADFSNPPPEPDSEEEHESKLNPYKPISVFSSFLLYPSVIILAAPVLTHSEINTCSPFWDKES